ncbi:MAG: 30S ribosomal protein S9 [Candidatus Parvarchaeota archaeon]|jgi:small subunit ribosomal protein S9|nr:30S ribosomal protein S9 [Candidatus Parvarchaeota archaeon]MCL5018067.1 30S ribosomal protein S9 [Candidatus Parvarchaeota archaeon]
MKKSTIIVSKRKTAVANAVVKEGSGNVYVNHRNLESYKNDLLFSLWTSEPIKLSGDAYKKYDIYISLKGGGAISRAQAVRGAIAKCLVKKEKTLRKRFMEYDRSMLVDDKRQTEPQKPYRSAARALKQTSYR